MKRYILSPVDKTGANNAGGKAGSDVIEIAKKYGYEHIPLYITAYTHMRKKDVINGILTTAKLCKKLRMGDIVFLQYPLNRSLLKIMLRMLKRVKYNICIATLVHDVDYLRNVCIGSLTIDEMKRLEIYLLSASDVIICHNNSMIKVFEQEKIASKLISLDLFDYLYSGKDAIISENKDQIIVAGNLFEYKVGYLYQLKNENHSFGISLYGPNLEENKFLYQKGRYYGSFNPEDLIENLCGSYGLVWDGPSLDGCTGDYGNYLKFNNPHKLSLYLAAGIPVIVWKESALYPFIVKEGVGFGVNSIYEIDGALKEYSAQYSIYLENVYRVKKQVRTGFYLGSTLKQMELDIINTCKRTACV